MIAPRVDTLNRRHRFAPAQPRGKRTVIDDDDIRMWTAIHTHSPLPTHYLAAFISKVNFNTHQKRLTKQKNGTEGDGPYLIRCPIDAPDPLSTTSVYTLHDNAKRMLQERGIYSPLAERKGWAIHQLMGSCITASIQLAAAEHGIVFIPRQEILADSKKPMKLPLSKGGYLVPDELFGLDYKGTRRYFVCEWDRNSEPFSRTKSEGVDFVTKLMDYLEVMRGDSIKKNTMVLIVTTSHARAKAIKEKLTALDPMLSKRFLINVLDYFQHPWKMPPILADVLEPWQRADGSMFDITRA